MQKNQKLVLAIFVATVTATLPASAQHAVKGEFQETLHAKAQPGVPEYQPAAKLSGKIRSIGADTMEVLMRSWLDDFKKLHPGLDFTMEAKASGTAGPALTAGTADLGPVAREMLPDEEKAFVDKYGYKPFAVRVAGGSYRTPGKTHAISFFVNTKNPLDKITYAQIDSIYSSARARGGPAITTWGQLSVKGELADKPIHPWGLIRPNGIAHFLEMRILNAPGWRTGISERTTVGPLAALDAVVMGVAADPYAIGYAGFGNVFANAKVLALAEKDGGPYFKGTFDEVLNQQYPLSRVIYVYVNRAPGKALDPKIREFLRFVLSKQGQDDVVKEGIFLPLPTAMLKQELAKIR